jgi:hypothetical protein
LNVVDLNINRLAELLDIDTQVGNIIIAHNV